MILVDGLSHIVFIIFRHIPSTPNVRIVFSLNYAEFYQMLSESIEITIWFYLSSMDVMYDV